MTKDYHALFSVPTIAQLRGTLDQRMEKGWASTQSNEVSDAHAKARGWIIRRGKWSDLIVTPAEEKLEVERRVASRLATEARKKSRSEGKWRPEKA